MTARRSFIRRRPFSTLGLLILFGLIVLIGVWRVQLQAFPSIISAYTAKEYCSCRYVMNQPVDYCQGYVKQWLPASLHEDAAARLISSSGMGRDSRAQWLGPHQGCRLLPDAP
ncbi:amidase [Pseudomonas sp. NPDC090202]|uniref:amidase n=1 Tax=unclassified Pseudomonas TaxID=196821 RepID=UPI00380ACC89